MDKGKRAIEILNQPQYETYSFVDQTIFLFLLKEKFLDKLNLEKVNLIGWSDGGIISLHLGMDHPELINKIVEWSVD